ncbi:hypothetical protein FOZ63_009913 [Perkinsus olseni]|uniref:Uncharacterized protein n=1 Tax=Perkinsus olseni TaxID=32597 RepID=A0A7J6RHV3_PEROL|nr:hypothetical protein FOZ63_009913 [Perkinsus olseni]KAF4720185.1 hypothetical protein FOZ62_009047 [Perkinsus olseni]
MFACGSVLLTVGLVFIRGRARLIPPVRASWSIVRKELTACDDVLELFTETLTLWRDTWLPSLISPTPILFTDSECNYFRLRRELRALKESCEEFESTVVDDSKLTSHKATLQLPAYERKVVRKVALALFRGGGEVRHISGEINPADPYSRGLPVRCPFEEDEALKIAIDVKNRDPTGEVLCAVPGEEAAVEEDDELIYEPDPQLVDSIRDSQKDDVFLKRLLDGDYACDRERRLYIVVDGEVRHAVTNALIVPSSRCREIIGLLHELFVHIGYYKIYLRTYRIFYCGSLKEYRRYERRQICIEV